MTEEQAKPRRRLYEKILRDLDNRQKRHPMERHRLMQEIVNVLWDNFSPDPIAWCGFYFAKGETELQLGACRDKPACSPISTQGVCGKTIATKTTQIIGDVKTLGSAYIECDPSHKSEISVPVFDGAGAVFAVLDIDSTSANAFGDEDRRWLERIVKVLRDSPVPTAGA